VKTLISGIADSVCQLLTNENQTDAIYNALAILGKATSAHLAFYFTNDPEEVNRPSCSLQLYWAREFEDDPLDTPLFQHLPYDEHIYQQLSDGKLVNATTDQIPEEARRFLQKINITSFLIVPMLKGEHFRSFIGLASKSSTDKFSDETEIATQTVATTLMSRINHDQTEQAFRESVHRYVQIFQNNPSIQLIIDPDSGNIVDCNQAACQYYDLKPRVLKNKNISHFLKTTDNRIEKFLEQSRKQEKTRFYFKQFGRKGKVIDSEILTIPIRFGKDQYLHAIIHDISDEKRAREKLVTAKKFFKAFVRNTPAAVAVLDRDMNYRYYSQRWTHIFELDEKNLVGKNHYKVMPRLPERWNEMSKKSLTGTVLRCEEDYFTKSNGEKEWLRWESYPWYNEQGEVGGIIVFSEIITDKKHAEAIRSSYNNQQLRMKTRMEAIEEERKNIARELHDGLGQLITAAHLNLELLEDNCPEPSHKILEFTRQIKNILYYTIDEVRSISHNLRPSVLDDFGLVPAIRNLIDEVYKTSDLNITLDAYEFEQRLPAKLETTIFRICQEALNNITKHSQATEVSIELFKRDDTIVLIIHDDGVGITNQEDYQKDDPFSGGNGILNMKERTELQNGIFRIESSSAHGTEIIIELPIRGEIQTPNVSLKSHEKN